MYLLYLFIIILKKCRIKHGSFFKQWATFWLSKQDEQNVTRLQIMQYDNPDYWLNFTAILTLSQQLTELLKQLDNATHISCKNLLSSKGHFFSSCPTFFKLDPQWYIAITDSVIMRHQSQNYLLCTSSLQWL